MKYLDIVKIYLYFTDDKEEKEFLLGMKLILLLPNLTLDIEEFTKKILFNETIKMFEEKSVKFEICKAEDYFEKMNFMKNPCFKQDLSIEEKGVYK